MFIISVLILKNSYLLIFLNVVCTSTRFHTSVTIFQMVVGSAGMLAFVFSCILVHVAVLINDKARAEKQNGEQNCDHCDIAKQVQLMYSEEISDIVK